MKGLQKEVGDGRSIKVWLDKWIDDPETGMRAPWVKNCTFDVNLMVSSLINADTRRWNMQALQEIFVLGDIKLIMAKQPVIFREDSYIWRHNRSGNLTVRSAYWLARDVKIKECHAEALALPSIHPIKEKVWKIPTAPKIRTFLWKALSEALPVADLLINRGMKVDERCQLCGL